MPGHQAAWIIRLGRRRQYGSLEEFEARFSQLALGHGEDGLLHVDDPEYGDVLFHPDGRMRLRAGHRSGRLAGQRRGHVLHSRRHRSQVRIRPEGAATSSSDSDNQAVETGKAEEKDYGMNSISCGLAAGLLSSTAFAGDVRVMWYSDGVEGEVIQDLLDRFMKDNPDIKVTLDNVAYKVVQEQLPVELEAGRGPISPASPTSRTRQSLARPAALVADPAYWQTISATSSTGCA